MNMCFKMYTTDNFELCYDFYFGNGTLQLVYGYHDENVDYFQVRGNKIR